MNSLPPHERGVGGGMNSTFLNAASVFSVGVFFTLMVVGLSEGLAGALHTGLLAHGVGDHDATRISELPAGATIFASFLGANPVQTLLGPEILGGLTHAQQQQLLGRSFFPHLIEGPFHAALVLAFGFAITACALSAIGSLARGPHTRSFDRMKAKELDAVRG
jgi:hypothetical protein